jgi:hypothetical protein
MTKKPLSDAQRRLVELDLAKAQVDAYYEQLEQSIKDVQAEIGTDGYFQADDGTVFKIVKPAGTFISYKDLNYVRTKRPEEKRGSLSAKEAQDAGYTVK